MTLNSSILSPFPPSQALETTTEIKKVKGDWLSPSVATEQQQE